MCEEMAFSDPDEGVRETAIVGLGKLYAATRHARVGKLLAQVVANEVLDDRFRLTAYRALVRLDACREKAGWIAFSALKVSDMNLERVREYAES